MASGGGNFGGFVPASYAAFTSAAGREISCVSMAFECYLRIPYDSRGIDQYVRPSSNTVSTIWIYVQYKVCDTTGDAVYFSCYELDSWEKALQENQRILTG